MARWRIRRVISEGMAARWRDVLGRKGFFHEGEMALRDGSLCSEGRYGAPFKLRRHMERKGCIIQRKHSLSFGGPPMTGFANASN